MTSPAVAHLARVPVRRLEAAVAGGVTSYWEYGPANADLTVVAVHGFRGTHHGLEPVVAYLLGPAQADAQQLRVISPDLPGFGETAPLPGRNHDLATYAQWLREFVDAVIPPQARSQTVILGHSFGSIVASGAVAGGLATPRLVLINPIGAPALEGPKAVLTRLAMLYYALGARLPRALGTALLRSRIIVRAMSVAMVKTRDRALRRFVHEQHDQHFSSFADRDVLHEAFVTSVSHDVREFAGRITVPVLLIAAARDDITPIQAQRHLVTLFADAQLVEIAEVGHLIHYETPAEAAAYLRRFLKPLVGPDR